MVVPQSLPDLVAVAKDTAAASRARIDAVLSAVDGQSPTDAQTMEITNQTLEIERVAVDIFEVFEARMQRHFRRGPLSRKVKASLLATGQPDLADKLHQHYLAINVLKHGTGASYRELSGNKSNLFIVHSVDEDRATGLVDVTPQAFFDGLADTILAASSFLENRQVV